MNNIEVQLLSQNKPPIHLRTHLIKRRIIYYAKYYGVHGGGD